MLSARSATYKFAKAGAMEVLEDVEEAVDEQGVILDELLGDLAGCEGTELRVDGVVPLGRHGGGGRGVGREARTKLEMVGARRGVLLVLLLCCELIDQCRAPAGGFK